MPRTVALLVPMGLLAGCFAPDALDETTGTDGPDASSSADETSATTPGTSGPTTGTTPGTGDATTDDPDTTIDPTVAETDTDSDTGTPACEGPGGCDSGVCVDMVCVPCNDAAEPDAACANEDPNTPTCGEDGSCVACTVSSCDGSTPACDPEMGCVACTEHSQCPESACHLGGPDQGSCFDVNDVVEVSDTDEFELAFVQGNPGGQLVIHLEPGTIQISGSLGSDLAEAAIIGSDSTITGGATSLFFDVPDLFYVSNLTLEEGPSRAITCTEGEELWLDDTSISDYPIALLSSCDVRVRRSQFRGNPGARTSERRSLSAARSRPSTQTSAPQQIRCSSSTVQTSTFATRRSPATKQLSSAGRLRPG